MAVYAVFEPPARGGDRIKHAERVTFVRDGFTWSAFFFGPLWMLRHRLWLALVLYVAIFALLAWAEYGSTIPSGTESVVATMLAPLVGLEAATLRRRKLLWWRWRDAGIVLAEDLEAAERRFFDRWVAAAPSLRPDDPPSPMATPAASALADAQSPTASRAYDPDSYVIGMFPPPGETR